MAHEAEIHHENHPGPKVYIVIGAILVVLTAFEVGAFLIEGIEKALMVTVLLTLSFAKFIIVVGYFMHIKFDDNRFGLLFFVPIVIMISIAIALLALFSNVVR
jgi:cytochrome c oxidase subunit 4